MARVNSPSSTKSPEAILDDAHASVRSEAEDERPSPAASNLTLLSGAERASNLPISMYSFEK
jgi:hypothetical protein